MYDNYNEEYIEHHGIKGMKWGVRRYQKKNGSYTPKGKKRKLTYREKVEKQMEDYNKAHPERSKKDNYTIAIRNAQREENERLMNTQLKSMMAMPLFGAGVATSMGNMYVHNKRSRILGELMDEHNIETAKRVLNM